MSGTDPIQLAIAAGSAQTVSRSPRAAVAAFVDFEMFVAADTPDDASGGAAAPVSLAPGNTYLVHVQMSRSPAKTATSAAVGASLELRLAATTNGITVAPDRLEVSASDFDAGDVLEHQFEITVAADCPIATADLMLRGHDRRLGRKQQLASTRVRVQGAYHLPDPAFRQVCQVRLDTRPPDSIAVLHVEAVGPAGDLQVTGYHARAGQLTYGPFPPPDAGVVDLGRGAPLEQTIAEVREFSRKSVPDLIRWLLDVLRTAGADAALVVVEHADTHIPWEMLWLDAPDRGVAEGPIGAKVSIVRWTQVSLGHALLELDTVSDTARRGEVIAHVDTQDLTAARLEAGELALCATSSCASLDAVRARLQTPLDTYALLFLACHGIFSRDDSHATQLGSLDPGAPPTLRPLLLGAYPALALPRPVAFLNACHSARLVRDHHGVNGLPEVFLAKFATAYLGTLGAVDDGLAAEIAVRFLRTARSLEGVAIAAFLRDLRREAASQLRLDNALSRRRYVHTFMYVLYGTPSLRLHLNSAAPAPGAPAPAPTPAPAPGGEHA